MNFPALPKSALSLGVLALNVTLVVAIAYRALLPTHTDALLATRASEVPLQTPTASASRTSADLAAVRDRALFHASRRYFVPTPVEQTLAPPPEYRLVGTLVIPRKPTVALLAHTATQERRKVKTGDDLDGWTVQAVENRRVLLAQGAREHVLENAQGAPDAGLTVVRLARTQAQSGGVRALGAGGAPQVTAVTSGQPQSQSAPRLYRPPSQ